jgi:hypothetical protein
VVVVVVVVVVVGVVVVVVVDVVVIAVCVVVGVVVVVVVVINQQFIKGSKQWHSSDMVPLILILPYPILCYAMLSCMSTL